MLTIADLARADQRVFPTHARVERYYPATAAEEARGVLGRCLDRGEGPGLLIGAPGTGKSMLLQVLGDELGKNRPVVCLTSAQLCTRRALLQSILFELGQSYRQRDEGDLRLTLIDYLSGSDVRKTGVLMLVDEAQSLPVRLLEELRVLGNISHQGIPTVRLLLAGSQSLEETFTEPEIEAFNQRIVARCYMAPLSHFDTAQFIRGHLAAAGAAPDELFTADALDAVYRATDGIARLVNQLCDRALLIADRHGQLQVTKEVVEGAWADLQQLPTPWNLPDTPEVAEVPHDDSSVVEFGPLSDDRADDTLACHTPDEPEAEPSGHAARVYEPEPELAVSAVFDAVPEPEVQSDNATDELSSLDEQDSSVTIDWSTDISADVSESQTVEVERASILESPAVSTDDLFGGDEFDEEVVIDDYASFDQTIPPTRPRVTSSCDADLGQLLEKVMQGSEGPAHADSECTIAVEPDLAPHAAVDVENLDVDSPFAGFSVIDHDNGELDELPIDETELDEESSDLLDEVASLATAAQQLADPFSQHETKASEADWPEDDIDVLVIDDEMSVPVNTAAAHRADYRQLFKTLRDN